MSRWQVVCECGKVSDTFIYPKNAEWNWDSQNPDTKSQNLLHDIQSKVHGQNLLNSTFGKPTGEMLDELLGDYKITDKGELALENQKNADGFLYWFQKHNEAQEEVDELKRDLASAERYYEKLVEDLQKQLEAEHQEENENSDYWYKEWQKAAQENEKLNMFIGKIKEVVE